MSPTSSADDAAELLAGEVLLDLLLQRRRQLDARALEEAHLDDLRVDAGTPTWTPAS